MNIGMLWFDSNPGRPVRERVALAADYYKEKYGRSPNLCFVHPSTLPEKANLGAVKVRPLGTVLPNHFWLGVKPVVSEAEN